MPLQFTNTPNTRRGVLHRSSRSTSATRSAERDQRRDQPEDRRHPGGLRLLAHAAADPGPRQRLGLFALRRGPRQSRLRRAAERGRRASRARSSQTPGMGFPISTYQSNVPQLDADVDRVKAKAQGVPLTELFDTAADLSRLGLRQRLQPVRPHLAGDRPGRRAVSRQRRGHRQPAHTQRPRRDGADRLDGDGRARPTARIR